MTNMMEFLTGKSYPENPGLDEALDWALDTRTEALNNFRHADNDFVDKLRKRDEIIEDPEKKYDAAYDAAYDVAAAAEAAMEAALDELVLAATAWRSIQKIAQQQEPKTTGEQPDDKR